MNVENSWMGVGLALLVGLTGCDGQVAAQAETEGGTGTTSGVVDPSADAADAADAAGADDTNASTGSTPTCGDGVRDADEECDGTDFGDSSCEDFGGWGALRCEPDCTINGCECEWEDSGGQCEPSVCGNGEVEEGEGCEGKTFECADVEGVVHGEGVGICTPACQRDLDSCPQCGDGVLDPGYEECDGPPLDEQGQPLSCREHLGGAYSGDVSCSRTCLLSTSACASLCENEMLDEGEVCDGELLGGTTCADLGFVGGVLACDGCAFDTRGCTLRGNGEIDGNEACDGEDFGEHTCAQQVLGGIGALTCTETCTLDTSSCETVEVGRLVISEVMVVSPVDPLFSPGEWIELHNPDPALPFPLEDCVMMGTAAFETAALDPTLSIPPGGYLTLGKGTPAELGFEPDGALAPQSTFTNIGDLIRIECWGVTVDELTYDDAAPWPGSAAGVSIALLPTALDAEANDDPTAWCASPSSYAAGRYGTPGGPNDCPAP